MDRSGAMGAADEALMQRARTTRVVQTFGSALHAANHSLAAVFGKRSRRTSRPPAGSGRFLYKIGPILLKTAQTAQVTELSRVETESAILFQPRR